MSALSIKLFNQELNFLKNIFRSYDTSPNDITADDMKMKSLQEDDAELDTGQDVLTLDEFVLNPPGYILSSKHFLHFVWASVGTFRDSWIEAILVVVWFIHFVSPYIFWFIM